MIKIKRSTLLPGIYTRKYLESLDNNFSYIKVDNTKIAIRNIRMSNNSKRSGIVIEHSNKTRKRYPFEFDNSLSNKFEVWDIIK